MPAKKWQFPNSMSQLTQGTEVRLKLNRLGSQVDVSLVRGGVFLESSDRSPHATFSSRDQLQPVDIANIAQHNLSSTFKKKNVVDIFFLLCIIWNRHFHGTEMCSQFLRISHYSLVCGAL
jgi:hypothetical protein